ncbi:MAG: DegQ family serine endoprotease [Burkholderiales bacterium]|nr:DegQ family serine endoprotease [Burkholderiales bacterium]MBZ0251437.1 DegQ family serine endoprotease [Burkholderiales bacterium]
MQTARAFLLGAALALGVATQAAAQPQPALPNFADLVEKHGPAVVNIRTEARAQRTQVPGLSEDDPMFEFFRRFMPPDQRPQPRGRGERNEKGEPRGGPLRPFGLGSGFVISADGYIVTNAHVIENAEVIHVRFTDKREMKAKVIGADKRSDVALVKVEAANLPFLKLGDSNAVRVGEWVLAIGSPFGFANSVTAGILSAKSRDLPADSGASDAVPFLQTDVAVNPGNSGGPLFNLKGEVIGINSQIFSRTGSYAGISFAIPIDYAANVIEQLKKSGKVTRGRIGVAIANVTRDLADSLGLPKTDGAAVGTVEEDSPAAKAGVEVGDVILKIDGRTVESSADLSRTIRAVRPGQKVVLSVWRAGKLRDITITVGEFKEDESGRASTGGKKEAAKPGRLGLAVAEVSAERRKALKVTGGVAVEAVDGAALAAGIQPGDVILRVNNTDIRDLKGYNEAVAKLDAKKPVALLVRDEDGTRFVTLRAEE